MNVDNVYIADIYMIERYEITNATWFVSDYKYIYRFFKKALVTPTFGNKFIDLSTGKKYRYGIQDGNLYDVGEMIIDELVPYVREVPVEKQHMSRKRVLKRYNEYIERANTESREE